MPICCPRILINFEEAPSAQTPAASPKPTPEPLKQEMVLDDPELSKRLRGYLSGTKLFGSLEEDQVGVYSWRG